MMGSAQARVGWLESLRSRLREAGSPEPEVISRDDLDVGAAISSGSYGAVYAASLRSGGRGADGEGNWDGLLALKRFDTSKAASDLEGICRSLARMLWVAQRGEVRAISGAQFGTSLVDEPDVPALLMRRYLPSSTLLDVAQGKYDRPDPLASDLQVSVAQAQQVLSLVGEAYPRGIEGRALAYRDIAVSSSHTLMQVAAAGVLHRDVKDAHLMIDVNALRSRQGGSSARTLERTLELERENPLVRIVDWQTAYLQDALTALDVVTTMSSRIAYSSFYSPRELRLSRVRTPEYERAVRSPLRDTVGLAVSLAVLADLGLDPSSDSGQATGRDLKDEVFASKDLPRLAAEKGMWVPTLQVLLHGMWSGYGGERGMEELHRDLCASLFDQSYVPSARVRKTWRRRHLGEDGAAYARERWPGRLRKGIAAIGALALVAIGGPLASYMSDRTRHRADNPVPIDELARKAVADPKDARARAALDRAIGDRHLRELKAHVLARLRDPVLRARPFPVGALEHLGGETFFSGPTDVHAQFALDRALDEMLLAQDTRTQREYAQAFVDLASLLRFELEGEHSDLKVPYVSRFGPLLRVPGMRDRLSQLLSRAQMERLDLAYENALAAGAIFLRQYDAKRGMFPGSSRAGSAMDAVGERYRADFLSLIVRSPDLQRMLDPRSRPPGADPEVRELFRAQPGRFRPLTREKVVAMAATSAQAACDYLVLDEPGSPQHGRSVSIAWKGEDGNYVRDLRKPTFSQEHAGLLMRVSYALDLLKGEEYDAHAARELERCYARLDAFERARLRAMGRTLPPDVLFGAGQYGGGNEDMLAYMRGADARVTHGDSGAAEALLVAFANARLAGTAPRFPSPVEFWKGRARTPDLRRTGLFAHSMVYTPQWHGQAAETDALARSIRRKEEK